jgi:hypothetical protein
MMGTTLLAPCGGLLNKWEVELVEMFFFFKWSASMSCITQWAKKNGDREQSPNTQENRGKILEMDVKAKADWKPTHFQCGSQNDYANRDGDANESMMCVLGKHPGVGAVWLHHILITGWWFGTLFIFLYIGNNHPNRLIFFRGVQTTNQIISI